jgi:hypothetical protein
VARVPGKKVRQLYDRLRLRYFMEAEPPLRVPPLAADLRWYWLPEVSPAHAYSHFDEDGDPCELGLDPALRRSDRFLTSTLLHELIHLRVGPAAECGKIGRPSPTWRREQVRLAALGAPLL